MRTGRPGLLGTMARTAVIAGTATTVSGSVARRQADRHALQEQQDAARQAELVDEAADQAAARMQAQQPAAAPVAASTEPRTDRLAQLKDLAELKAAGVLTEAEFAAEKARILSS